MAWNEDLLRAELLREFASALSSYGEDVWTEQADAARAYWLAAKEYEVDRHRSRYQRQKKQVEFRKRRGVCVIPGCVNLAVPGITRCEGHRESQRQKDAISYATRKKEGRCVVGGCPNQAAPGCTRCVSCLEKANSRYAKKEERT